MPHIFSIPSISADVLVKSVAANFQPWQKKTKKCTQLLLLTYLKDSNQNSSCVFKSFCHVKKKIPNLYVGKSVEEMGCSHKTLLRKEKKAILGKKKKIVKAAWFNSISCWLYLFAFLFSCLFPSLNLMLATLKLTGLSGRTTPLIGSFPRVTSFNKYILLGFFLQSLFKCHILLCLRNNFGCGYWYTEHGIDWKQND